ncbi:MAG: TonB-dependent receptor [Bacteroidales bacterium]|nr:TonB-dependent receptor [Bacteroidales bacterium]
MKRLYILAIAMAICAASDMSAQSQGYPVKGRVIDRLTREGIPYAAVIIVGVDGSGVAADSTGLFTIPTVKPGINQFSAIQLGYRTVVTPEYKITPYTPFIEIEMDQDPTELAASSVRPSPFLRSVESPVSVRVISLGDIDKIPGANKDIARIVRSYPGVSYSPIGYRNDLIVRGGGPSENTFFIDGIEIPNINHFATQGATGGPVSLLNSDLIREISFYTGSFPSNRGGALSSVMDISLKDGNMEKQAFKVSIGASEAGISASGHMGPKTTYIASVRQSYLQLLFKLLGLPMLPNYIDGQFKIKTKINERNEIMFLGIGGIDNLRLNMDPDDKGDEYLLSYLPKLKQETFTAGISYKHFSEMHIQTMSLSYNYLNNRSIKYRNNDESIPDNLTQKSWGLDGKAQVRFENRSYYGAWTLREGAELSWRHYSSQVFRKLADGYTADYGSKINYLGWGIFTSADYKSPNGKLRTSFGIRADGSSYSKNTAKIWKQLSPRASISYSPWENWSFNASAGMYHQLPPVTALSFRNANNELVNSGLDYMRVISAAIGTDWKFRERLFIGIEGFYKQFLDIPLSVETNIPLTCLGADYGSIGEEALISSAQGRSYGVELLAKWLIPDKISLVGSATLYKSEFRSDRKEPYIPSAWDNRFIINLSAIYQFPRYWSIGAKISSIGGAPYTPYDKETSSLKRVWDAAGRPVYDYLRYNQERLAPYYQIDLRIDKDFYFNKWTLSLYVDLQNVTFSKIRQPDAYLSTGNTVNPEDIPQLQRYELEVLELYSGTIVPSIGITVEF